MTPPARSLYSRREGLIELARLAHGQRLQFHAEGTCCRFSLFHFELGRRLARMVERREIRMTRINLTQQLQPLRCQSVDI